MGLYEARLTLVLHVVIDVLDLRVDLTLLGILAKSDPLLRVCLVHERQEAAVQLGSERPQLQLEAPDSVLEGQVPLAVVDLLDGGVLRDAVQRLDVLWPQEAGGNRAASVALAALEPPQGCSQWRPRAVGLGQRLCGLRTRPIAVRWQVNCSLVRLQLLLGALGGCPVSVRVAAAAAPCAGAAAAVAAAAAAGGGAAAAAQAVPHAPEARALPRRLCVARPALSCSSVGGRGGSSLLAVVRLGIRYPRRGHGLCVHL
mmetsp:Transcript_78170/g.232831  ORF Transcript_78170/g.232831 Transcript_78170/m.232831 type:complete len:257 (-) Transcript_78170:33-803(-)